MEAKLVPYGKFVRRENESKKDFLIRIDRRMLVKMCVDGNDKRFKNFIREPKTADTTEQTTEVKIFALVGE